MTPNEVVVLVWSILALVAIDGTLICLIVALFLPDAVAFRAVLPILSNGGFLLPAMESWRTGHYTYMMVYGFIIVASSMYHACYAFGNTCHLDPLTYQTYDFLLAQLVIPLTALHVVRFPGRWQWVKRVAICSFIFIISWVQLRLGQDLYIQMVIASISLLIIVGYWFGYNIHRTLTVPNYSWQIVPDIYNWTAFGYGIGLTCISCALFVTQMQSHLYYWSLHSCWHITAPLGQYYILRVHREPDDPVREGFAVLDERISKEILTVAVPRHGYNTRSRKQAPPNGYRHVASRN